MAQLNQLEQQMKEMQKNLNQIKQEQKQKEESKYNGPNIKIKLLIGTMEFMSDADTLFHKQNGNTVFYQKYTSLYQNIEDDDIPSLYQNIEESKLEQPSELYFARNPELFQYILDYLSRSYHLQHRLRELTIIQLEKLQDDAQYFQIVSFWNLIKLALTLRYNPYMKSPLLQLNSDQTCATRSSQQVNLNQAIAVYGVMKGTVKRFIEFTVLSHGNLYVKLGVGEANPFRITRFPGRAGYPGCSFYGGDGNLYRNGGTQSLGNGKWKYGDRIGIGVDLNRQNNTAIVAFYVNGTLMKNKLNLKDYMDISKGVVFVVSLYTANDCVCINQDPVIPQSF